MNTNSPNRTKIGRIATFLALTFGLSTFFWVKIITGGEGIESWVLPLMLCPAVSALLTKLIFDRNLKGAGPPLLGWPTCCRSSTARSSSGSRGSSGWAASRRRSSPERHRGWAWPALPLGR